MNFKKITGLFSLLAMFAILLSTGNVSAQSVKGKLNMTIKDVKADLPQEELDMMKMAMSSTLTTVYYLDDKSLVKTSVMGGLVEMLILSDNKNQTVETFSNIMGQKNRYKADVPKMEEQDMSAVKVEKVKGETMKIEGFKCQLYTVKNSDGSEIKLWTTDKIKIPSASLNQLPKGLDVGGFPMRMEINNAGVYIVIEASDYGADFDEKIFELNRADYPLISEDEFIKSMGQMGM